MPHSKPIPYELERFGAHSDRPPRCAACGQRAFVHEDGGRCDTILELAAAMRVRQQRGRWPVEMLAPPAEETP